MNWQACSRLLTASDDLCDLCSEFR